MRLQPVFSVCAAATFVTACHPGFGSSTRRRDTMKESHALRSILVGVVLIAIGLVLPSNTPQWMRAVPIVAGSMLALSGSYLLIRLPGRRRNPPGQSSRLPGESANPPGLASEPPSHPSDAPADQSGSGSRTSE